MRILCCVVLFYTLCAPVFAVAHDALSAASKISVAGMQAQSQRLKVVAQNIANAGVTSSQPGGDPYSRQMIFFRNSYDEVIGADVVKADSIKGDKAPFQKRYLPQHPAADKDGFVKYPNVNPIIEVADAKEAQLSFEANAASLEITKHNQHRVLDLMR